MPEITLSLPAAFGLLALLLTIGAVIVYFLLHNPGSAAVDPTQTATTTATPTITITPTITATPTIEYTATPLPPVDYKVGEGDSCISIAAFFNVSVRSIVTMNNSINSTCSNLTVGMMLKIPQPTPTPSPQPTATLGAADATKAACKTVEYTVKENDSLSTIAANYAVSITVLKEWNGLVNDNVYSGTTLEIPLCKQVQPNAPTPTPTSPPPYAAPNLLLPADGAPFTLASDTVTLQWASVGTLRSNEAYAVTVEDVTEAAGRKLVEYVTDTKFIVPVSFRPTDTQPHVMRWSVMAVRQTGTTKDGEPMWSPAGAPSIQRVFTWVGVTPATTPTP